MLVPLRLQSVTLTADMPARARVWWFSHLDPDWSAVTGVADTEGV